jgi:predicted RNase H-like HicB family nuclease
MLTYTAIYKVLNDGVHGEVIDFPGVITSGKDIAQARRLLAGALVDMAETNIALGESLPVPISGITEPEADVVEPIHLILNASSGVKEIPETIYEAA